MIATTKNHEQALNGADAKIEYDRDLFNRLYRFMKRNGWIKEDLPFGEQVIEFHKMVCLNNPEWPSTESYINMYNKLMIRFDKEDEKTISNFMYKISNINDETDNARKEAIKKQKLQTIKQAKPTSINPKGPIHKWDERDLMQQFSAIKIVYDESTILKKIQSDSNTYTKQIYNELVKRGLIEPITKKEPAQV